MNDIARAPGQKRMKAACVEAADHYRRSHMESDEPHVQVQVMVDPVPHLAPEFGQGTDWYKVGSLFVEPLDRMLHVYLEASTGAVKLEQPPEDVISLPPDLDD